MKQRIFSNYYRVAFYGKKFEGNVNYFSFCLFLPLDMDKKAYVYKEPQTCMLPVFTAKLIVCHSLRLLCGRSIG
jgi:hypothetical protein